MMKCKACEKKSVVLFFDNAWFGRCRNCYILKQPLKIHNYLD
jgi:hypothetical protein